MQELSLTLYGNPVLKLRADSVPNIDKDIDHLAEGMLEVMEQHVGVGLAAPQVGVSKRLIIVGFEEDEKPIVLVNPEITFRSGLEEKNEGCLSLPGVSVPLKRAEKIRIAGTGLDGKSVEMEAEGLVAKAFQHEIDHIDGILITDRIGKEQLMEIADHLKAIERGEVNPLPE